MGIYGEYHRHGVGTLLVRHAEKYLNANGYRYLTVKALADTVYCEPYERTRRFYHKLGFVPPEVFPLHWDALNPCLFLAKYLDE